MQLPETIKQWLIVVTVLQDSGLRQFYGNV